MVGTGRQPINFGVGISSWGYKHIGKAKVLMIASESHRKKAWIKSPLARQAIALHRGRTTCSTRCSHDLFCPGSPAVSLDSLFPWWAPTGDSFLRSKPAPCSPQSIQAHFLSCSLWTRRTAYFLPFCSSLSHVWRLLYLLSASWRLNTLNSLQTLTPLVMFSGRLITPVAFLCYLWDACRWYTSISKAVSIALFSSIISFKVKDMSKATLWPAASVRFCWRSEGHCCHLVNIGFNPDCISLSLLCIAHRVNHQNWR